MLTTPWRAALVAVVLATLAMSAPAAPAALRLAPGVGAHVAAGGIRYPTNIAFDARGGMWLTSGAAGARPTDGVWYVPPGSRRARHVAGGLHAALGLAWMRGRLYVSNVANGSDGRVTVLWGFTGRGFRHRRTVVRNLHVGQHQVDTIVPGRDGRLYVGVGSQRDASGPPGTIVSFLPGGRDLRLVATGLRNPYGLAFVPGTSILLVTDNGRDDLGPGQPPDELNAVDVSTPGVPDFGFPGCWEQAPPAPPACDATVPPVALFPPHASADGIAVARDWAGQGLTAFVAENGPAASGTSAAADVRAVHLTVTGRGGTAIATASVVVLAAGFAAGDPLGAAVGPDGSLYVTRYFSRDVLRFSAGARAGGASRPPTAAQGR